MTSPNGPDPEDLTTRAFVPPSSLSYRYDFLNEIGTGATGIVYKARDRETNVFIAVKVLKPEIASRSDLIRRFKSELVLARKITHRNVCRVHDLVRIDQDVAITMEYIDGESLRAPLNRADGLSIHHGLNILRQIIAGVREAHAQGVIHRDLKPENILVGRDGIVKVMDFGIARLSDGGTTSTDASITGTPAYMSPEQAQGKPVDVRSDIYALGLVMYEMFCGRRAFSGDTPIALVLKQVQEIPPPPNQIEPHIPAFLDQIILKCIEKDPANRFQSMDELAAAVAQSDPAAPAGAVSGVGGSQATPQARIELSGLPRTSQKPPWLTPRLWTRREWTVASSALAVSLVSGAAWLWRRRPYRPSPAAFVWYERGLAAMHSMTYEAARKALEQAVVVEPEFALAHAGLARTYDEMDYSDRAKESMLRAITVAQESVLSRDDERKLRALQYMVSRDYERAGPLLREIEEDAVGRDKAPAALESGWLAQQRDDTDGAAAAYARAIRLDPSYAAPKLRLGFIFGRRGRQEDIALALNAFSDAERLYSAASDYEGVTETLLQKANLLNRRNRPQEAMPVIDRALTVARTVGNRYQEIRLQLLQGVAYRQLGETDLAASIARKAIDSAVAEDMHNLASSGMIDLGNSYLEARDPRSAEPLFRSALELARRGQVRRNEARAQLSLGSLFEQEEKPQQARPLVEAGLKFYQQRNYRRETVQAAILLGAVLRHLGDYDEGVRVLKGALPNASQLQDKRTNAQLHERIAEHLRDQGQWPGALTEYQQAAESYGPTLQAEIMRVNSAGLQWRLNQREDAGRSLSVAGQFESKARSPRLLSLIALRQAEIAYDDGQFDRAREYARQAESGAGDEDARQELALLRTLLLIQAGQSSAALDSATKMIEKFDRSVLAGDAASTRLSIAEALVLSAADKGPAEKMVVEALAFFEPRRIWESIWRGHLLAARLSQERSGSETHVAASRSAVSQLRSSWSSATVDNYLRRPDIKVLSGNLSF